MEKLNLGEMVCSSFLYFIFFPLMDLTSFLYAYEHILNSGFFFFKQNDAVLQLSGTC